MKQVLLCKSYKYDSASYVLWAVKDIQDTITYGRKVDFLCFELDSLASQLGLSKEDLDFLVSIDLQIKDSVYYHYIYEPDGSSKKKFLILAKKVNDFLMNVRASGKNPNLDISKEKALILSLIEKGERGLW